MRIIGGSERGRRIEAPPGSTTRPITDRAKEAIFNMLATLGLPDEATVVDLFAGSGSFGLESLSRGAAHVTFVERDRTALATLRGNVETLGYGDRCRVLAGDVHRSLVGLGPVDLAFCDPPYADDPWLELLDAVPAEVVVAHAASPPPLTDRWSEVRRRTYGRAHILIAERHSDAERHPDPDRPSPA